MSYIVRVSMCAIYGAIAYFAAFLIFDFPWRWQGFCGASVAVIVISHIVAVWALTFWEKQA